MPQARTTLLKRRWEEVKGVRVLSEVTSHSGPSLRTEVMFVLQQIRGRSSRA